MTVREWVYKSEIIGHSTFSYAEISAALPSYSRAGLSTELNRLRRSGVIASVHKGFYVTIPTRYKATGIVPPLYYIDSMFRYLEKPYYVSLLSAAQLYGAAHQKPLVSFVTTVLPRMSISRAKNPYVSWVYRKQIPAECLIRERKGEWGSFRCSSPELTALELVQYEHQAGGLNNVATVLAELVESIDFSFDEMSSLFSAVTSRTVQRAGYIMEEVLGEKGKANALYDACKRHGVRLGWAVLSPSYKAPCCRLCKKWKIRINTEVEVDDL